MLFSLLLSFFLFAQEEDVLKTIEQPIKTTDDGQSFYDTKSVKGNKKRNTRYGKAVELEDGSMIYDTSDVDEEDKKQDTSTLYGKPQKKKGQELQYEYEKSEQSRSVSVQFFSANFEDFQAGNVAFEDVYSEAKGFSVDYEWQLKTSFAKFGLILNSGLLFGSGDGRFADDNTPSREEFDIYLVPLQLKARFNLEFLDTQYVVPFIEGGGGIIGLLERRDDGDDSTFAYTPVFTFGGGLAFLLDWMMGNAVARLDNDMGINHVWLIASFNIITATDDEYDLSDEVIMAGFKIDY